MGLTYKAYMLFPFVFLCASINPNFVVMLYSERCSSLTKNNFLYITYILRHYFLLAPRLT